jgi:hypothetical protein
LDLANAVRGMAILQELIGADTEAMRLWEEALKTYERLSIAAGVSESAAWLALLAWRNGQEGRGREWLAKAAEAAEASGDPAARRHVEQVRTTIGTR